MDSLSLKIALGDSGPPREFHINLRTGVSSTAITAQQGQPYALTFVLFSAGHRIGEGESRGTLECDLNVALSPRWIDTAIVVAKKELERGTLLPVQLTESYNQGLIGTVFTLPLDSLPGITYRWIVRLADSLVITGEGSRVSFPWPASLAGKTVIIRLQALEGTTFREERKWDIAVLTGLRQDRLARVWIRADSTAKMGNSISYRYAGNRLAALEGFDTLTPEADRKPVWLESLTYGSGPGGPLTRALVRLPGGAEIDSLFRYNGDGRLEAMEVRSGGDTLVDSLTYDKGRLARAWRRIGGKTRETAVVRWTDAEHRIDSIFVAVDTAWELTRIIRNRYRADSLVERQVLVGRKEPVPYLREIVDYNGLGQRAWRRLFSEGEVPALEQTDLHGYDFLGRPASMISRDEMTGNPLLDLRFFYEAGSPSAKLSARMTADRTFASDAILWHHVDEGNSPLPLASPFRRLWQSWPPSASAMNQGDHP